MLVADSSSALVLLVNPNDFRAYMVQQVAARSEYQLHWTAAGTYVSQPQHPFRANDANGARRREPLVG